ncbi:complex I subunit 1/NuoH family protein [Deinococcus marmoris]|uniref:NADH-ubiquinone oxidoreductase chain H n=1 Tax=Deinococcus marmoris TaxID=249408 RepID=A0A1U7NWJ2_9DEIO|nr:NADH-quinone oxidoreductase subunit H [Deinococcus marmoris]OLV17276.1 NADH-ubiquinone oxidoreductase chain H [Deinococcus marmoris]
MGVAGIGIVGGAFLTLLALCVGAALTFWLERALTPAVGAAQPLTLDQDVQLGHADRWMYPAGPISALFGVTAAAAVLPFGPGLIGADLGIGAFYFIVVVDFVVLGVALGGWGAGSRNAVESFYRITAQLVSYVVPLGLAYVGALMMAASLSTTRIVEAQSDVWFIVLQPLGFILYLITGLMQAYRAPFYEPLSEHIGGGVLSAVGGWKALLWRVSLAGLLFVVAAMGALLYLGGWLGPWLPGPVWMLLKTFALMALMLWLGRRFKPLSTAQMLSLSWRILIPAGLLNVLIVGGLILAGGGPQ